MHATREKGLVNSDWRSHKLKVQMDNVYVQALSATTIIFLYQYDEQRRQCINRTFNNHANFGHEHVIS